jgi:hypothetical protein
MGMPQTGYPCAPAIKAFFVKIDEPVNIRYEVLEFPPADRVCLRFPREGYRWGQGES